jgi:hypothetical protein
MLAAVYSTTCSIHVDFVLLKLHMAKKLYAFRGQKLTD